MNPDRTQPNATPGWPTRKATGPALRRWVSRVRQGPPHPHLNPRHSAIRSHSLKLTGEPLPEPSSDRAAKQIGAPITGPKDPRWILALRTSDLLQGDILAPQDRDRLLKLGKVLGLTPFDANMIIAIIQDQARRGYEPRYCAAAGEPQLRMIPLPTTEKLDTRPLYVAGIIGLFILAELLCVHWLLG